MPIAGISEVVRLPRLGKIKLGLKKEGDKGPYPTPTDYFVCPPEVQEVYGERPKQLDIMFPVEDEGVFASQWLRRYSQTRGCICWGDGRTANRLMDKATGAMVSKDTREVSMKPVPCDPDACPEYQSKNCRRLMNLQFLLPQVKGLGIWQLNTSSRNSILNINGMVDVIRAVCGRIAMIPLTLSLEPQEVVPPGGTKKVVRVLQLRACLLAAKPVHVLLVGPPALAKSLFLWELERVAGDRAKWVLGSSSSKAGLLETLLTYRPWLLLVDEIERMSPENQAVLLSILEGGRLSRIKVGKMADVVADIRVVAACNRQDKLAPELLSRFSIKRLYSYTPEQYQQVVEGVLVKREGCPEDMAREIATSLVDKSLDVRDAIRVARLAPQLGVGKAVRLLVS